MLDIRSLLIEALSEKIEIPDSATMKAINAYCEEMIIAESTAFEQHLKPFMDSPKAEEE